MVATLEFAPADIDPFLEQVRIVRGAASDVGLDERFRWDAYRWDNTVYFVSWHESLVDLEDQNAMIAAFQGTDAFEVVMGAFEKANALQAIANDTEILMQRPDLSYMPAEPAVELGAHGGLYLVEQWPIAARRGDFEESVKNLLGMLAEMKGGYPVIVSQTVAGDGSVNFAVVFDDLSTFYGEGSLERGLADAGMAEAWATHATAHQQLIARSRSQFAMYLPGYSYRPDLAGGM